MRKAETYRKTEETEIKMELVIDGSGISDMNTGIPFFDHMLRQFSRCGVFDLCIEAKGDLEVDDHHTVEDVGIVLGKLIRDALTDEKIQRFGYAIVPMDDSLATCAIDVGGRSYVVLKADFETSRIGSMSMQNVKQFLVSLADNAKINIYVEVEGENDHHKAESLFKSLGLALRRALEIYE